MNRQLLVTFVLALVGSTASAQLTYTLSGVVRDSATNQPLNRAAVVLNYEKSTTGTYTNAGGEYSITIRAGAHVVVVRHVGYVPYRQTVRVRGNTQLNVRLPSVSSQLEEVVVTSKGYDRNVRQPLLGVSQINIAALKRMPAALGETDILRSL